jgi:hypothetical protein
VNDISLYVAGFKMGNNLACYNHNRGRRFSRKRSRTESANFDFRAPEDLLRGISVHGDEDDEEEVGLDPTTIPAWMEETLGMDIETWLRLRDALSRKRLRARLKMFVSMSPERLKAQLERLLEGLRMQRSELVSLLEEYSYYYSNSGSANNSINTSNSNNSLNNNNCNINNNDNNINNSCNNNNNNNNNDNSNNNDNNKNKTNSMFIGTTIFSVLICILLILACL